MNAGGGVRATLITPLGAGGIAVIALAGDGGRRILQSVFVPLDASADFDEPGRLMLGELLGPEGRIDEAIVLISEHRPVFRAEINLHGGPRIAQRALQALGDLGAEIQPWSAERAPESGGLPMSWPGLRNDGVGRELLACLARARTGMVLEALTSQWSAGLSRLAVDALAELDAKGRLTSDRAATLQRAGDRHALVARLLDPPEVVLAGPPNVGKSSLANALLGRPACLVSATPGATRDWVRELAEIHGVPVWLTDTAGLWRPEDPLDAEAVERAWRWVDRADLVVCLFDSARPPDKAEDHWRRLLDRPHCLVGVHLSDGAESDEGSGLCPLNPDGLAGLKADILGHFGLDGFDPSAPAAFTARQAHWLAHAAAARPDSSASRRALSALLNGVQAVEPSR